MTSYRLCLMVLFLACPLLGPTQADEVDTYAAAFIDKHKIPGLSLAVVQGGKLVKAAGYGFANLELKAAATAETAWEIGSITKHFTAQAVMLLVQDDKLTLGDTLGQRLDGVPPPWEPLTLRQLLTHTSGLKDWETEGLLNFRREYTDAEYIALMSPFALDFKPGERWSYTNTAYPLLGMVIARVSGKPYDEFVTERIFNPMGMSASRFSHPLEIVPHRASGYVEEGGRLRKGEPLRPRIVEPNGAVLSSVLDLARWARAFEAGALLRRESLIQMMTPVRLDDGSTFPSGLGIFATQFRGHRLLLHNGSTPGGFSSVFYHYPDDKLTVFVLCNIDRGDAVNKIATRAASFFVPGLDVRSLAERTDPDPKRTEALLAMLRDLAGKKETTLASPEYRMQNATRALVATQLAGLKRFAFLESEARPNASEGTAPSAPATLRYKLVGATETFYYSFRMTAGGKVAELEFEEE
jgi:CubicO group peptidase (beta-lactamase class C family)